MDQKRIDHQIFTRLFPGVESDRDPVAVHKVLLVTVFGVWVIPTTVCCGRRDSPTVWDEIYDCFSSSVNCGRTFVQVLRATHVMLQRHAPRVGPPRSCGVTAGGGTRQRAGSPGTAFGAAEAKALKLLRLQGPRPSGAAGLGLASAPHGRDRNHQQGRERSAPPLRAAAVGNGGKGVPQGKRDRRCRHK